MPIPLPQSKPAPVTPADLDTVWSDASKAAVRVTDEVDALFSSVATWLQDAGVIPYYPAPPQADTGEDEF